jgi:putative alpha-1,2-mannosidase
MTRIRLIAFFSILTTLLSCCTGNEKYVNMFIGRAGDHGQMTPAATVPFGAVSLCPDSRPGQHGGYDYNVTEISGISINRISGVGCRGVGGNISILPAASDAKVHRLKETENAYPGYYETGLSNGVHVALTATKDMAVERYTFSKDSERILSVDFASSVETRGIECGYEIIDDQTVNGWVLSPTACARGRYKLHFTLRTDKAFTAEKTDDTKAVLRFKDNVNSVEVRISISSVDLAAAEDVAQKWQGHSFRQIRNMAKLQWREKLSKIDVYGSTEDQKGLFYSLLYRVYLSPMDVMSDDMRYKGTDGEIYHSDSHRYYSSWSMWDTFRTKFPLLAILEPEVSNDICWSLAEQFRCGKRDWATPHESAPTVRTEHSVIALLDCWKKGINDFSFMPGYKGMKDEADFRLPMRSPDQKLESSYDLWAIAQIAEIAGREDDAERYRTKADSLFYAVWPSEFMNVTSDFTQMRNNGLYQGSRWQYRWAAPHFLDKMIALAGKEQLESELDYFFDHNLLNQGNEPCLHIPFIYNLLDAPEKTQKIVRALITDEKMVHLYGGNAEYPEPFIGRAFQNKPDGFAPEMDEDDGAMSAWYLFCSMGFYPVCVGTDSYEVFSPLYDKIVIDNGKTRTTIKVEGRKNDTDILKSISYDGKVSDGFSMKHSVFEKDTEVVLHF